MQNILVSIYPWTKALHLIAVIAWMAGLFYLPRLYVYHTERIPADSDSDRLFVTMERRLLTVIMNPAMVTTWIFGILLALTPGIVDWSDLWPWMKAVAVIAMTWFHHWLASRGKDFAQGVNEWRGRHYRLMNEIPTVLLVLIIVSVVIRPF